MVQFLVFKAFDASLLFSPGVEILSAVVFVSSQNKVGIRDSMRLGPGRYSNGVTGLTKRRHTRVLSDLFAGLVALALLQRGATYCSFMA